MAIIALKDRRITHIFSPLKSILLIYYTFHRELSSGATRTCFVEI